MGQADELFDTPLNVVTHILLSFIIIYFYLFLYLSFYFDSVFAFSATKTIIVMGIL